MPAFVGFFLHVRRFFTLAPLSGLTIVFPSYGQNTVCHLQYTCLVAKVVPLVPRLRPLSAPQPVQQLREPDLEFEGELINADTANTEVPEPGDTQSRLQHSLAALCLRRKPSESIEPRMLRVFLDRVVPDAYRIQPKDALMAMLMHKHFSIPVLTTREAVGKTSPSEHETSYGVQYRTLCIVGPDPKYNTDRTFAEESDERLRAHYMYLKSILSTHSDSTIRELKWTLSDVVTWFKEAKVKKRSKKVVTCNVQFPPPLIHSCSL